MTYTPPEGVTIGTFTADTMPASFTAPADAAVSYKIYGTSEGAGLKTDNLFTPEDTTFTISNVNFVFENGKIILDGTSTGGISSTNAKFKSNTFHLTAGTYYYSVFNRPLGISLALYKIVGTSTEAIFSPGSGDDDNTFTLEQDSDVFFGTYIAANTTVNGIVLISITPGSTPPPFYIPPGYKLPLTVESGDQSQDITIYIGDSKLAENEYVDFSTQKIYKLQEGELTPTDPPATLPTITATGETTISSTETLGDVEFTGDWLAIMGSTEDESIDIEFTVDAEEYIAFVTVDDGPSIQVSDTITMPSSADSFTLEVVAWGRERYTDTVYNALS